MREKTLPSLDISHHSSSVLLPNFFLHLIYTREYTVVQRQAEFCKILIEVFLNRSSHAIRECKLSETSTGFRSSAQSNLRHMYTIYNEMGSCKVFENYSM